MRDDSRGLWINDTIFGCAQGMPEESAIALALQLRASLAMTHPKGIVDLSEEEVIERARKAWADANSGKFQQWGARKSVVRVTRDEIEQHTPEALKLLGKLRAEHSARCARGEDFTISASGLDKSGFMPRKKVEKARAELLKVGKITVTVKAMNTRFGKVPARFKLLLPAEYQGGGAAAGQS
jgi:hypothetical protein